MKIGFFEEYPSSITLSRVSLLIPSTPLILAAPSLKDFLYWEERIHRVRKNIPCIYWPLLKIEEGYWFSAFSNFQSMKKKLEEIKNFHSAKKIPLFLDLELPLLTLGRFFFLPSLPKTKRLLSEFILSYEGEVITGEIPFLPLVVREKLGLHFPPTLYKNKILEMLYSSILPFWMIKQLAYRHFSLWKENLKIGLGCISRGITGMERVISPAELERDLKLCRKIGVREVFIYRLEGLEGEYIKILKKFWRG